MEEDKTARITFDGNNVTPREPEYITRDRLEKGLIDRRRNEDELEKGTSLASEAKPLPDDTAYTDPTRKGVPVIGISRQRLWTDGDGITTLVAFQGCPLRCRYCLNKESWEPAEKFTHYTPQSLYEEVKGDDVYFRATGGGITFGGGEPCLRADFIVEFRKICNPDWKIRVETSLNVPQYLIDKLAPVVDEWIIDTKAERSVAYKEYTGTYRNRFHLNLFHLTSKERLNVPKEKIHIRVPVIPGFVTTLQANETTRMYRMLYEYKNSEKVEYKTNEEIESLIKEPPYGRHGKNICRLLRRLRREIAEATGIEFEPMDECNNVGECSGICPLCEREISRLSELLKDKPLDVNMVSDSTMLSLRDVLNPLRRNNASLAGCIIKPDDSPVIPGPPPPPKPAPKTCRKQIQECAIAGLNFHVKYDDELWDELDVGVELALIRQRDNKYDSNAIAVALADDYNGNPEDFDFILGYIPRSENGALAAMLDSGYFINPTAVITSFSRLGKINDRIRITVYVDEILNEKQPKPVNYFAEYLSAPQMSRMVEELAERGTAYFRFGGFPPIFHALPSKGDKIVMIHENDAKMNLFLMHVLATGDKCRHFVDDPESINCVDDCLPFILTNITGPITASLSELWFLRGINVNGLSVDVSLPSRVSNGFKSFFDSLLAEFLSTYEGDPDLLADDVPRPSE